MGRLYPAGFQFTDGTDATPAVLGSLTFSVSGSATSKAVYSDETLTTSSGATVNLDSEGRTVSEVFGSGSYRVRLWSGLNGTGTNHWTKDNVRPIGDVDYPQTARETAASVTPTNTTYPEGDIRRYGASTASANNSTAIQNAVNANKGGRVYVPSDGTYTCTANIVVPVGTGNEVVIYGDGWGSHVRFSGAAVTKGFDFNNSSSGLAAYDYCGGIHDMRVSGTSSAKRGVDFANVQHAFAKRVYFSGFDGTAIRFFDVLVGRLERCLIQGSGNSTEYAVHVTGTDSTSAGSTTFVWDQSYISGGLAGGATTKLGGLGIDRCIAWAVRDGAIESTGTPIVVCGISTATRPSPDGHIQGIDLENPGNNLPYIDVGQGWTGTASLAASNLLVESITTSMSGTTASTYGIRLKNTIGARFINAAPNQAGTPTSSFELDGANNIATFIGASRVQFGNSWPWVRENSAHRTDATPRTDWQQMTTAPGEEGAATISGANPSCLISTTQGGYYGALAMSNGGATTVLTLTGGRVGMRVTLVDPNGNTTLTHAPGTTNAFRCTAGVNLAMAANQHYQFRFDGTRWCQF